MVAPREVLLEQFETFSTTFIAEVGIRRADDAVRSTTWPTVGALAGHVEAIYLWVTAILRTGAPSQRVEAPLEEAFMVQALQTARDALLGELRSDDRECWVIGGSGSTAFWRRRMVVETLKHLLDLRTGPNDAFVVPEELTPPIAADGIDELFEVFLARSRAKLPPLPGAIRLAATDVDRSWRIASDWSLAREGDVEATIEAPVADLALLLWERASATHEGARFVITGDTRVVRAFESAPIHA